MSQTPTAYCAVEMTIAHLLSLEIEKMIKEKKSDIKNIIEFELKNMKTSKQESIELYSSIELLKDKDSKKIQFVQNWGGEYFPYSFYRENDFYIPFKQQKNYEIKDDSLFADVFGEDELNDLVNYSLLSKTELLKKLKLKSDTKYEDIITKIPQDVADLILIKNENSIVFNTKKIKWDILRCEAKKYEEIDFYFQKTEEMMTHKEEFTIEHLIDINIEVSAIKNTAELYILNEKSRHYNTDFITIREKQSISYDKEKLKELIEEKQLGEYYSLVKPTNNSKELSGKIKRIITGTEAEEVGVEVSNSIILMSSVIKSGDDIAKFIKNMPEAFYDSQLVEIKNMPDVLKEVQNKIRSTKWVMFISLQPQQGK